MQPRANGIKQTLLDIARVGPIGLVTGAMVTALHGFNDAIKSLEKLNDPTSPNQPNPGKAAHDGRHMWNVSIILITTAGLVNGALDYIEGDELLRQAYRTHNGNVQLSAFGLRSLSRVCGVGSAILGGLAIDSSHNEGDEVRTTAFAFSSAALASIGGLFAKKEGQRAMNGELSAHPAVGQVDPSALLADQHAASDIEANRQQLAASPRIG